MLCRSSLPSAKSTAKVPPFSMRGVRVIAAIHETAQDYSSHANSNAYVSLVCHLRRTLLWIMIH